VGKSLEQVLAAYLKRKGKQAAASLTVEKLAKAAKKKPEDRDTIEVLVDWGDLIPEVTPYLETDAVAGATEFLTDRGIVEDSYMWTKVLDQARQMARSVARNWWASASQTRARSLIIPMLAMPSLIRRVRICES